MKKMKQLLTLLLILGLALGFRSFEQIRTKSVVIPFSDGKEGMVPSEETDAEIKAVPLEEVESFSNFEISSLCYVYPRKNAALLHLFLLILFQIAVKVIRLCRRIKRRRFFVHFVLITVA